MSQRRCEHTGVVTAPWMCVGVWARGQPLFKGLALWRVELSSAVVTWDQTELRIEVWVSILRLHLLDSTFWCCQHRLQRARDLLYISWRLCSLVQLAALVTNPLSGVGASATTRESTMVPILPSFTWEASDTFSWRTDVCGLPFSTNSEQRGPPHHVIS